METKPDRKKAAMKAEGAFERPNQLRMNKTKGTEKILIACVVRQTKVLCMAYLTRINQDSFLAMSNANWVIIKVAKSKSTIFFLKHKKKFSLN